MRLRCAIGWLAVLALTATLTAAPSRAEAPPPAAAPASAESEEAGKLFDQGLADMLAGRYEAGCPALAKSYELEPLPGALFTLAECEVKWGKLATALGRYRQYLEMLGTMSPEERKAQAEREKIARDQLEALRAEAPKIEIVVPPDAPPGTSVALDGHELTADDLSAPVPVDPGKHRVTIAVPGGSAPNSYEFEVVANERRAVRLALPAGAGPDEPEPDDGGGMNLRDWSYVVGAVGGAFLLVGIITGAVTMGEKGTIEDNCLGTACNPEGLDAADRAEVSGAVSTVGFVVGGAALAAAVVMWIVGGDDDTGPSAEPAPGADEVALQPVVLPATEGVGGLLLGLSGRF